MKRLSNYTTGAMLPIRDLFHLSRSSSKNCWFLPQQIEPSIISFACDAEVSHAFLSIFSFCELLSRFGLGLAQRWYCLYREVCCKANLTQIDKGSFIYSGSDPIASVFSLLFKVFYFTIGSCFS